MGISLFFYLGHRLVHHHPLYTSCTSNIFFKKYFQEKKQSLWFCRPPILILIFLSILLLNWGVNRIQYREYILSRMLKDYSLILDKDDNLSENHYLSPDIKSVYPIYEKNDLHNVNEKYDKVVMILVESWGGA